LNQWLKQKKIEIKQKLKNIPSKKLLAIAASTGGPGAPESMISQLPGEIGAGGVLVQHMPAMFTKSFAARLDAASALHVKEAQDGDEIVDNLILVAPGGKHMKIAELDGKKIVRLEDGPLVKGVKPSADVTMKSAVPHFKSKIVAIILTGMGDDGSDGIAEIKNAGEKAVAQDEKTSTVYGMPKAVVERGLADKVLPLNDVAQEALELLKKI